MRDILFRGGWIKNGEWIEGYYVFLNNTHYIIEAGSEDWGDRGEWFQVVPKSVGQFTGLKDKNGKKIFEGDILEYKSNFEWGGEEVFHAVVFWDSHRWSYNIVYNNRWTEDWNTKGHKCDIYKGIVEKYGEVIGNIYNNPELLG